MCNGLKEIFIVLKTHYSLCMWRPETLCGHPFTTILKKENLSLQVLECLHPKKTCAFRNKQPVSPIRVKKLKGLNMNHCESLKDKNNNK